MSYLDFDIEISTGSGREYPIAVLRSAAGEAREIMFFPFDDLVLENRILTLQNMLLRSGNNTRLLLSSEERFIQDFGCALFNALFTGEVRSRYVVCQHEALLQGKGLRVRLHIRTPKLAMLPWEFMYDPNQAEHLCLSNNTPVVRYIELPQPLHPLTITSPLSILGMTASPKGLAVLDIEREKLRVEKALERLRAKGMVKLSWLTGQTWQDLQRAMRRGPWHIFHFIGHGGFNPRTDEGLIALEDDDGHEYRMSATNLGRMLIDHRSLRLVVLNSCEGARGSEQDIFSSTASILVRRGIPAVLAMQYEITDKAAIELSRAFYEAVAEGMAVDMAVSEARKAISFAVPNTIEWGTPVLYMRSPDGNLFDLKQTDFMQEEADMVTNPPLLSSSAIPEAHRSMETSNVVEDLHLSAKGRENGTQIDHTTLSVFHSQPVQPFTGPFDQIATSNVEIFCCYAYRDEQFLHQLKAHLRPLARQGLFRIWSDREITESTDWEHEIDNRLNTAQLILLLVSPDFMDSEYVYGIEMRRAMDRHDNREAMVIPIILRPVHWQITPLGELQAFPTDGKPVISQSWHSIDEAFFDIVTNIIGVLRQSGSMTIPDHTITNTIVPDLTDLPKVTSHIKIFTCYAREDEALRRELVMHLKPLQSQGIIDVWYDRDINAGQEWEKAVYEHMNEAQIILLLVSPDFINSDFCYGKEMMRAIERHKRHEAYVIPILLRPVYWQNSPFSQLQILPIDALPVTSAEWPSRDHALLNVAESIAKVCHQIMYS